MDFDIVAAAVVSVVSGFPRYKEYLNGVEAADKTDGHKNRRRDNRQDFLKNPH